ncbi:MAG: phosphatidate cytidylyltransferase [Spirochaetaceae bacterium]|jgi:phosphatidate cytidylyltransferase|nr:phosphatidate cytidylyltransferase [Spirochaetaceae bacterium]
MTDKAKNVLQRVLIFVIGLPLTLAVVFFFPQKNHLVLNLLVSLFCTLGACEFAAILRKKGMELRPLEAFVFGLLPTTALTLYVSFRWTVFVVPAAGMLCAAYCLVKCAFTRAGALDKALLRLAAGFSVIMYPGVFLGCIILMSKLPHATVLLIVFLCTVLANDSFAWFFGMIFGRGNKGIIAASPNKSIVGFIGGFAGSMAVCVAASIIQSEAFTAAKFPATASGIILGLTTGLASTVGDLAESALKRSSGVKDSGSIVPGRGGILDSVDSISLAAAIFYIVYHLLFIIA